MDVPIEQLDENFSYWRKLYFLRRSIQTLEEIRGAIETLRRQKEFKELLSKQTKSEQEAFEQLSSRFSQLHSLINQLRNRVGGHVLDGSVMEALEGLKPGVEGFVEIGSIVETTHFRFTRELLEVMVEGTSQAQQKEIPKDNIRKISELTWVLLLIVNTFRWYAKDRGLV